MIWQAYNEKEELLAEAPTLLSLQCKLLYRGYWIGDIDLRLALM